MNIFDIIDKKKVDEVLKQNGILEKTEKVVKEQPQQVETSIQQSQGELYADKFLDFINTERKRIVHSKALKTSLEHLSVNDMQRLHLLAKFIKQNPNMTEQDFGEMIQSKSLVSFNKLFKEYPYDNFVEEIRDHGSLYIASKINLERELGKLYDDIEEIDFNNSQSVW